MENIKSLESDIKKKLENAFDIRHIYEIFSSLVTTITEQNEEIDLLRHELNETKGLCSDLISRVKTVEFNIQGFDSNNSQTGGPELTILDLVNIEIDPTKGFVKRPTTATPEKKKDSRPPTARKRTESKGEPMESKVKDIPSSGGRAKSASPSASRTSSLSVPSEDKKNIPLPKELKETATVAPNDAPIAIMETKEKPTLTATIESQNLSSTMIEHESLTSPLPLPEVPQQPPDITPLPLDTPKPPLTHRLSEICHIPVHRTPEEEIAWKAKKRNIMRRMYAKMTFLINVTNAAQISCKLSSHTRDLIFFRQ